MQKVQDAIEELIETSYLLGLSEQEIREDLVYFMGICGKVLRAHVQDKTTMNELVAKLNLIKEEVLAGGKTFPNREEMLRADGTMRSFTEWLAERAARNKRLILKAIEECDPGLVALIQEERFYGGTPHPPFDVDGRYALRSSRIKLLLLKIAYVLAVVCIFLLVYLMIRVG